MPAFGMEMCSITDAVVLHDLRKAYGEERGLEVFIEQSSELELERIRSGNPIASACRDEAGRPRSRAELDRLGDQLEERLRSLEPGWLTRVREAGTWQVAPTRGVVEDRKWWLKSSEKPGQWWSTSSRKPRTPAPRATLEEYDVELLKKRSTRTVQISRSAFDAIWDECDRHDWQRETGGGLYAHRDGSWSWDRQLRVTDANVAAVARSYTAVTLSSRAMREESEHLTRYFGGEPIRVVGDWHAQPEGCTDPSLPDLQGWAHGLDLTDQGIYIGIIATEPSLSERSRKPRLHAWVVRYHEHVRDKIIVEPADVVFRP